MTAAATAEVVELTKTCTKCREAKPLTDFYTARRETDGKTDWCRLCMNEQSALYRAANPENRRNKHKETTARFDEQLALTLQLGLRRCCDCGLEKPYSDFPKFRGVRIGVGARCRKCNSAASKKWVAENPERSRTNKKLANISRKYGLSAEAVAVLLQSQGNKCAICREELDLARHTCVDHNHATGAVRGILCRKCNIGIGQLRDSQKLIRAALQYLVERDGDL